MKNTFFNSLVVLGLLFGFGAAAGASAKIICDIENNKNILDDYKNCQSIGNYDFKKNICVLNWSE